jgi:hypothetical protein
MAPADFGGRQVSLASSWQISEETTRDFHTVSWVAEPRVYLIKVHKGFWSALALHYCPLKLSHPMTLALEHTYHASLVYRPRILCTRGYLFFEATVEYET